MEVIKRVNETIDSTDDLGKLSAALKALVQVADGNKVTTTISQTISRLRGRSVENTAEVVSDFTYRLPAKSNQRTDEGGG